MSVAEDPGPGEQAALIEALLVHVPFDGWTRRALRHALADRGADPHDAAGLFPRGATEMVAAYAAWADRRMAEDTAAADLAGLGLTRRVRAVIALRLARNRPYKEAVRRALAVLALPANAPAALRITGATVDAIWHAAGDRSADFSWYTKRAILAAVWTATLLYWLRDSSAEDEATLAFLDRRLAGIGRIGKLRGKLAGAMERVRPARFRPG